MFDDEMLQTSKMIRKLSPCFCFGLLQTKEGAVKRKRKEKESIEYKYRGAAVGSGVTAVVW
jgi:hypothetical protein